VPQALELRWPQVNQCCHEHPTAEGDLIPQGAGGSGSKEDFCLTVLLISAAERAQQGLIPHLVVPANADHIPTSGTNAAHPGSSTCSSPFPGPSPFPHHSGGVDSSVCLV